MKVILVVDDSSTMRRSIAMSLELSGYKAETACDGLDALNRLKTGLRPDMILTDIIMPRMDGIGLIREARKLLRFTPIIALTTQGQLALREQAKQVGATAWMIKPVGGTELVQLLADHIGAGNAAPVTTSVSPKSKSIKQTANKAKISKPAAIKAASKAHHD